MAGESGCGAWTRAQGRGQRAEQPPETLLTAGKEAESCRRHPRLPLPQCPARCHGGPLASSSHQWFQWWLQSHHACAMGM